MDIYSPWNSPGKNTGVGSLSLPADLPDPGIEPGSPALQADSLKLSFPTLLKNMYEKISTAFESLK